MIATIIVFTIATVTLAASAANTADYTQGLSEPCDMVSYCQQGLQCTTGLLALMVPASASTPAKKVFPPAKKAAS